MTPRVQGGHGAPVGGRAILTAGLGRALGFRCAWALGGFLAFQVFLLLRVVLGAELDDRGWCDGQCPVNLAAAADHRALVFCSIHFGASANLSSITY